tara:strand:- start:269 stop:1642 length:1374 start_codon:yes stop_codon:yes gene_type:complete
MAYTLIETVTVGSGGASSIEFTGIPQEAGADLVVRIAARSEKASASDDFQITLNSDTTTAYDRVQLIGSGSGVSTFKTSSPDTSMLAGQVNGATSTANTFTNTEIQISNYTSTVDKSVSVDHVREENATAAQIRLAAFNYNTSSEITSLKIEMYVGANDLAEGSTASLYLVTTTDASGATNPQPKATGGTISFSGGYWYHTFYSSGTFTPTAALTCDYLVVSGGGGGGSAGFSSGGGGGAGGMLVTSGGSFTVQDYTVAVGSGGSGGSNNRGNNGSSSSFNSVSPVGGGGGGGRNSSGDGAPGRAPASGGSGGGGNGGVDNGRTGASGTGGQGSSGGNGGATSNCSSGGGGGAGATGQDGATSGDFSNPGKSGNGGTGNLFLNTGVRYAGGGGGGSLKTSGGYSNIGTGGSGGGGNGGVSATANTGGGGGGANGNRNLTDVTGSSAGSGITIVRYAA